MRNRHVTTLAFAYLLAALAFASATRADLIIQNSNDYANLERYSTSGVDLGVFNSGRYWESIDVLLAGANGDVYGVINSLGTGVPIRLNSSGAVTDYSQYSGGNPSLYLPAGGALVGGVFYSGGTDPRPELLAYDAKTLDLLGNVLPSSTTVSSSISDVASDGSRLYVVDPQKVTRFTVDSRTKLTQDLSFQIPVFGHIRFKPDDQNIYLDTGGRIDRYSVNGQLEGTFIPAGIAGLTGITDFAFGDDGFLYVTGPMSDGSELLKFDATTGDYLGQLNQFTGPAATDHAFDLIVFQTPEPSGISLFCLLLLVRRRTPERARGRIAQH